MFGIGAGLASVIISQQAAAFATISPDDTGRGTAISASVTQMSAAVGVAVLVTILTASSGGGIPTPGDFHDVFLAAATMTFAGSLMALRIHDQDAAGTMRVSPPVLDVPLSLEIPSAESGELGPRPTTPSPNRRESRLRSTQGLTRASGFPRTAAPRAGRW